MGFGGALYVVYFSPVVLHYFKKEQLVTVNALNSVAYNVGGIMAMLMVGPVVSWLKTWQYSMGFFAIISAILFVLWPFVGQNFELNKSSGVQQEKYTIGEALKDKFNWVFPFTYSGLLTFYIVLLNIFPISGTTVIASKTLSMLVAIGGVVGTILAIIMGKKYTKRLPVIRWCGLAMTLFGVLMFFTTSPALAVVAAVAIGIFMFLPVTSLVLIPQELPNMTPAKLTTIMGLFWAISYIIESVVYYIIGIVIDSSGYTTGLMIALVMSATFFIGSFLLPETGKESDK